MNKPYILTPEKLKEMALGFEASPVAKEKLDRAKKAIARDREWLDKLRTQREKR